MKNIRYILCGCLFCCGNAVVLTAMAQTDTVNVAFKSVGQRDLLGGVSTVNMAELNQKLYSTYTLDNMQAYIGGWTGQLWNQGDALVLVDGVPRDAGNVLPSEIESITFMKAASAVVLYGSRAAKGAVLITTKRGHANGLEIKVSGNATLYQPKRYADYLGAAEYMTLYNEALANDGKALAYSEADIANYASGNNRYRYPDIDFFSGDYVKNTYQRYEGTAEFQGGGKYAHFYTNINLSHQNDLINFGEGKDNHTNRLGIRGNIDLTLNDWVTGWVDVSASFYDARNANADFWGQSATVRPTSQYPLAPLIPISMVDASLQDIVQNSSNIIDGQYLLGGTQNQQTNALAGMYAAGYNKYTSRQLQFDAGVKFDLRSLLNGLSFKAHMGVDYATSYSTSINNEYSTYEATWDTVDGQDVIVGLTKYGVDRKTGTQSTSGSYTKQTVMFSGQFDYARSFGLHHLDATLLAHGWQQTVTGVYHRTSNANLGLQVGYNWAHRYYADLSMAAVHSAKLAEDHREALSPVLSAAWRLSEEPWLNGVKWIDDLKLTASYGVINQDIDISDYYMYDKVFTASGTWWGWSESANTMLTSDSRRSANEKLGFVKRKELRLGANASFGHGLVTVDANFFTTLMSGLLVQPSTVYPNYFHTDYPSSSFLPYENYNKQRRTGFDFTVAGHKRVGPVDVNLGLTGMYYTSKNVKISENVEYDWLKSEGQRIDALRGYQCLGFFQSEEEIASSAVINSDTRPGDLKYKDQNGDGIIDDKDMVVIGHYTPDFYLGLNLTLKWKDFTLFVNGTGDFGGTALKDNMTNWVYGDRKYTSAVRGRWTTATAATATYPRLTTEAGTLNFVSSDFWTYSTSAFRLNRVQLTYQLPKRLFANSFLNGASVYLGAYDLLTISKERRYMETNVGAAPQTRSYNIGFNVTL